LKDLLSKLGHYNSKIRIEGIKGIIELIKKYKKILTMELSNILKECLPLITSSEEDIRKKIYELFELIFLNISNVKKNLIINI
jgi:hypothetical protein